MDISKPFITPTERAKKFSLKPTGRVPQVYGYVRVSTQKQVLEGASIGQQIVEINDYCTANKLPSPFIFKDEGKSGTTTENREQFSIMLYSIVAGDIIIAYNMSRVSRSTKDFLSLLDILKNKQVGIIVIKDRIVLRYDSGEKIDAGTELIVHTLCTVNQFEAARTRENTSAVMQSMKRAGTLATKPQFGWKNTRDTTGKIVLIEEPSEQDVINFVYADIITHPRITNAQITRDVNEELAAGRLIWRNLKSVRDNQIAHLIKNNGLREAHPTSRGNKMAHGYDKNSNRVNTTSTATTTTVTTTTTTTLPPLAQLVITEKPPPPTLPVVSASPIVPPTPVPTPTVTPPPTKPMAIPGAQRSLSQSVADEEDDDDFDVEDDGMFFIAPDGTYIDSQGIPLPLDVVVAIKAAMEKENIDNNNNNNK